MTAKRRAVEGRPRSRRWIVTAVVWLPILLVAMTPVFGGWRYGAGPETALLMLMGVGATIALEAMLRGRWTALPSTMRIAAWTIAIRNHAWPIAVLVLGFGALCWWRAGLNLADWFVPTDSRTVIVISARDSLRSPRTEIVTDGGAFQTPWFVFRDVYPGPAEIVLGHFSGHLLAVHQ